MRNELITVDIVQNGLMPICFGGGSRFRTIGLLSATHDYGDDSGKKSK